MTSKCKGGGHSVVSSLLSGASVAGAVCGGGGEEVSTVLFRSICDHSVLSPVEFSPLRLLV